MTRYFNVAGLCNKAKHYIIEASSRLRGVDYLIDTEQYFVIHAARQSGKKTYLYDLAQRINADGKYYALYCSLEGMQKIVDVAPHLILMAFLQRIINGGGYIIREMAAGTGRTDLCIVYGTEKKETVGGKNGNGDRIVVSGLKYQLYG